MTSGIRKWAALVAIFVVGATLGAMAFPFPKTAAADGGSGTVRLETAVRVGSVELPAGDYKVSWTGPSDDAQVTLKQNQTTASATAKVVEVRRNADSYVTKIENGTRVLTEIQFSKITLVLNPSQGEPTSR